MQVSYFVLYVTLPCLVGLAAEINKSNQESSSFVLCHSRKRLITLGVTAAVLHRVLYPRVQISVVKQCHFWPQSVM